MLLHNTLPVDLPDLWSSDILILAFLVCNPGDLYYLEYKKNTNNRDNEASNYLTNWALSYDAFHQSLAWKLLNPFSQLRLLALQNVNVALQRVHRLLMFPATVSVMPFGESLSVLAAPQRHQQPLHNKQVAA